mmetsp:Transcript_7824/g.13179  ORF Transcript_7824/g.13179 Transcript_7824/m.13179 type:complete len:564 (+) Transcript_7824:174-1865(+)
MLTQCSHSDVRAQRQQTGIRVQATPALSLAASARPQTSSSIWSRNKARSVGARGPLEAGWRRAHDRLRRVVLLGRVVLLVRLASVVLRGQPELLEHHDPLEALLHHRVGRRGARGDADARGAVERQEVLRHLHLAVDGAPLDRVVGPDALLDVDVVAAQPHLVRDLEQVRRVRRVPPAHHEHKVERRLLGLLAHLLHRVLPHLRRVADRVEGGKVLLDVLGAEGGHHGLLEELSDRLRLLLVHGGLVGKADLAQVYPRVEVRRRGVAVLGHQLLRREAAGLLHDIRGNLLRLLHVLDDQVRLAHGGGGDGFLVRVLAVDDRRHLRLLVLVDGRPHLGDPRARRVDGGDALVVQQLHLLERGAEGGKDHHVPLADGVKVLPAHGLRVLLHELDAHPAEQLVDARVVDQLVRDVDRLLRVRFPRRPRELDRALDAPAEAVLLGEHERHLAGALARRELAHRRLLHLPQQLALEPGRHLLVDRRVHVLREGRRPPLVPLLGHDAPALRPLVQHGVGLHQRGGGAQRLRARGAHALELQRRGRAEAARQHRDRRAQPHRAVLARLWW